VVDVADEPTSPRRRWSKPPRLYEEIARDLTEEIVHGRYAPGAFLPTEHELAKVYGASRNVVREALKVLMARGLVEMLHGRGSRVLPHQHWQMQDQLIRLMREDPRVPRDLLTLRRILEVEIAQLAAQQATAEQIAAMQETIDRMQACAGQPEECIKHDVRFHQLLAEATGNVLLPLVLEPVGQFLVASRLATIHNPGAVERSVAAHAEILGRVAARDADGACQAMRHHLLQVEEEIRRIR
jgi:DNA-binding FadR family transcriptional regulator